MVVLKGGRGRSRSFSPRAAHDQIIGARHHAMALESSLSCEIFHPRRAKEVSDNFAERLAPLLCIH
jgi:hypothetical protein